MRQDHGTEHRVARPSALPPILAGSVTPDVERRVERFFFSVAEIFEAWVARRSSAHTQRSYRGDVMSFVHFLKLVWPEDSMELLRASVKDVHVFRDELVASGYAPKTISRRISSLSSFYKYLAAAAAELRLPITLANPAHAQFVPRSSTDPREETRALTATKARQLMGLPTKDLGSSLVPSLFYSATLWVAGAILVCPSHET